MGLEGLASRLTPLLFLYQEDGMKTYRYRLRVVREEAQDPIGSTVGRPIDLAGFASRMLVTEFQEVSLAFFFNRKHRLTGWAEIGRGGIAHSPMEPREVLVTALAVNAAALAVAHNHPSGDPSPSHDDIAITRRLTRACELVGLEFLDHLIIGEEGTFTSTAELGI